MATWGAKGKRTSRSRPASSAKLTAVVKKLVAPAKKPSIAKKVSTLQRKVKTLAKESFTKVWTFQTIANGVNLSSPYLAYNLSKQYYDTPLWGQATSDFQNVNKAYLNSLEVGVRIRQANEPNLIRYTMFLVSLKDQAATTTLFDPISRELTLTSGGDDYAGYGLSQYTDLVRLNPMKYNIHAVKRFTMGYEGTAGPTSDTYSERRFDFKINPRQRLLTNPKGDVFGNASFISPNDVSQNYFLIVFNDNASGDLEYNKIDVLVNRTWAIA